MLKEEIMAVKTLDHQIAVFYLGQEGFLIRYQGTSILIDAYLSDYVDRNCCTDSVVWKRKYDAPIVASELDFIDYVFCTHPHFDHADPNTLTVLNKVNKNITYIIPYSLEELMICRCRSGDETFEAARDTCPRRTRAAS